MTHPLLRLLRTARRAAEHGELRLAVKLAAQATKFRPNWPPFPGECDCVEGIVCPKCFDKVFMTLPPLVIKEAKELRGHER